MNQYVRAALAQTPLRPFNALVHPAPLPHPHSQQRIDADLMQQAPRVPAALVHHQAATLASLEADCRTLAHARDASIARLYLQQAVLGAVALMWAHCVMLIFIPPFSVLASLLFFPLTFAVVPLKDQEAASRAARDAAISALDMREGERRQAEHQLAVLMQAQATAHRAEQQPFAGEPAANPVAAALAQPRHKRGNPFSVDVQESVFARLLDRARPVVRDWL